MKDYNFEEVITNIKEGETYKCTDCLYGLQTISKDNIGFKFNKDSEQKFCGVNIIQRFVKVEEPVSFTEAVTSGKRIKVDVTELNEKYREGCKVVLNDCWNNIYMPIDRIFEMLSQGDNHRNEMILEGKWYIEED